MHAGEEKLGCDIIAKALRAPVRLIASNAGVEGDVIIEKLLGKDFEIGYNAVRAYPGNASRTPVGWTPERTKCLAFAVLLVPACKLQHSFYVVLEAGKGEFEVE